MNAHTQIFTSVRLYVQVNVDVANKSHVGTILCPFREVVTSCLYYKFPFLKPRDSKAHFRDSTNCNHLVPKEDQSMPNQHHSRWQRVREYLDRLDGPQCCDRPREYVAALPHAT